MRSTAQRRLLALQPEPRRAGGRPRRVTITKCRRCPAWAAPSGGSGRGRGASLPYPDPDHAQEYIANKLQKQADQLGAEKAALLKEKSDLQRQARPACLTLP